MPVVLGDRQLPSPSVEARDAPSSLRRCSDAGMLGARSTTAYAASSVLVAFPRRIDRHARILATPGYPASTGPPSSSGLGLRPFTPAARVRIPLGVFRHAQLCGNRMVTRVRRVRDAANARAVLSRVLSPNLARPGNVGRDSYGSMSLAHACPNDPWSDRRQQRPHVRESAFRGLERITPRLAASTRAASRRGGQRR